MNHPGAEGIISRRDVVPDRSSKAPMHVITTAPGEAGSLRLETRPEPSAAPDLLLVEAVSVGICGTDREIAAGLYGVAPPGHTRLVLGHEALGRVVAVPPNSGLRAGDLIAAIVRRPDPAPCGACAGGEYDMCRNGLYVERGIKGADGYMAERFHLSPAFAVRVDPDLGDLGVLTEPASIVAKAWDHIDRIGRRSRTWRPRVLAVTGAGPVGLLAALLGVQRGLQAHVFDQVRVGPKPDLVTELGATYHEGLGGLAGLAADIIVECTGAAPVIRAVLDRPGPDAIVCLTGVSTPGACEGMDLGAFNRRLVLGNDVIFGSVNANRTHYELALAALRQADRGWLERLITRRVPLERWREAFEARPDDIKVALQFTRPNA